ncbi:hypothetical protein QE431_001847 [Flavobacterium sp. SORGH_AS 622]|nr:hypothetical protein [Flavobacterium sp. SORGH_AS_0622]
MHEVTSFYYYTMSNIFSDNSQIGVVSTFAELVHTDFKGEMNALCWYRNLDGDFNEIVAQLHLKENITEVYPEDLQALQLSEKGNKAREIILNDLQLLSDFGASPSLNLLKCYDRDDEFDFISTDVYSFHVDRSPIATDTFLCTYHGASSDIISNSQAEQKILVPEIRTKLKELYDGPEEEFENFLKENYFDLHYQLHPNAEPINLGLGHLWRLAVDHPKQQVQPCIHRAPVENEGEYRLLLIC